MWPCKIGPRSLCPLSAPTDDVGQVQSQNRPQSLCIGQDFHTVMLVRARFVQSKRIEKARLGELSDRYPFNRRALIDSFTGADDFVKK
jgi:hypothetical protein